MIFHFKVFEETQWLWSENILKYILYSFVFFKILFKKNEWIYFLLLLGINLQVFKQFPPNLKLIYFTKSIHIFLSNKLNTNLSHQ